MYAPGCSFSDSSCVNTSPPHVLAQHIISMPYDLRSFEHRWCAQICLDLLKGSPLFCTSSKLLLMFESYYRKELILLVKLDMNLRK
jgi:hypothetical protein